MKKERKDGLFLDNKVYITDEKKPGLPIQSRIVQLIAILIGSWGSIGVLMESIAIPANIFIVDIAILFCVVILFALCLVPGLDLVKLFFGFLFYGLFLFSRLHPLQNGFYILENQVLVRMEEYYEFQTAEFIADYTTAGIDCTLLLIMIVIPVVMLLTVAVVRNRLAGIAGIVLFLPVTISFIFGLIPSERYLIAYLAAVLYLSRSGYSNHKITDKEQKLLYQRINSKAAVWLSMICLVIFFLLKLFISEEKYESINLIKNTKVELQTAMFNFSLEDLTGGFSDLSLFPGSSAGGLEGGELGNVGKVKYTESEQLRVTAERDVFTTNFYLKGYVGSVYTGDSWVGHNKKMDKEYKELADNIPKEEFNAVNQVSKMLKLGGSIDVRGYLCTFPLNSISIEYNKANKKYMYVPYYTDFENRKNVKYIQDLYAAPEKKRDEYTYDFYNFIRYRRALNIDVHGKSTYVNDEIRTLLEYEQLYRDFVYEAYTELPEEGLVRLKADFSSHSGSINDKISSVISYLNVNTTYSLSPGKLPKGEDFVEYFLYENKKGYCAHYASAATLMLRSMGVPARYVEGYVISPSDIAHNKITDTDKESLDEGNEIKISVKDYNAHAWVEIYFDKAGWIPFDFTPGTGFSVLGMEEDNQEEDAIASITPTQAPIIPPHEDKEEPQEKEPDATEEDTDSSQSGTSAADKANAERLMMDQIFIIAFWILLSGSVLTFAFLFIHKRRKMINTKNRNKRAIFLFARIEKILTSCRSLGKRGTRLEDNVEYVKEHCIYIDPEEFTNCMEIVRKARFGKGRITSSELGEVEMLQKYLLERVYQELPLSKKLYLKLLLGAGVI